MGETSPMGPALSNLSTRGRIHMLLCEVRLLTLGKLKVRYKPARPPFR